MTGFENNFLINNLPFFKKQLKQNKELLNKPNQEPSLNEQSKKINNQSILKETPNPPSNVKVNQSNLTNPTINQAALNESALANKNINSNLRNNLNEQSQTSPAQLNFQGPKDVPLYAGIANISLKNWILEYSSKNYANLKFNDEDQTITLEGIKGFQKKHYEGFHDDYTSSGKSRNKNLLVLSHLLSALTEEPNENEVLLKLIGFRKLGAKLNEEESNYEGLKQSPPIPNDLQKFDVEILSGFKFLHQLFSVPSSFPECLRIFAKEGIEINERELRNFLIQRVKVVQKQLFGSENKFNDVMPYFVSLLGENKSLILPLTLLYYPLPLPYVKNADSVFIQKKAKEDKDSKILANCSIYYSSEKLGRFLISLNLTEDNKLNFHIDAANENTELILELEEAISHSMMVLEYPPLLSELTVKLTNEIYEATDKEEELSIISSGPLRLEIILAVYSILLVLNKANSMIEDTGFIEIKD